MISIPTVLILGAGSSNHCGYPLGRDLVANLCSLRGTPDLDGLPRHWSRENVERFLTRLSHSDPSSIDSFLEANREDASLGKFLIARELKRRERLDLMFPPKDAGWYRYLFNKMLVDGKPAFDRNGLTVVTFNYDRSLEAYIATRLQAQFGMNEAEAAVVLAQLPIFHVHGVLGDFPNHPYSTKSDLEQLLEISSKIQIIHELSDSESGFCNEMFEAAQGKLRTAERIYFLGFGFHPDNLRRFKFFNQENTSGKLLRATVVGMGPIGMKRLRDGVAEIGIPGEAFHSVTCNQFFEYTEDLL